MYRAFLKYVYYLWEGETKAAVGLSVLTAHKRSSVILVFRRDVYEICFLLGCYAALSGSSVPTFRDNLSVPFSRVKKSDFLTLQNGTYTLF
jgi:hypothetical protein